jgi:hypothetical protein
LIRIDFKINVGKCRFTRKKKLCKTAARWFKLIQTSLFTDSPMATITDEALIEKCKELIEEKTGWGKSENWSNRDFEELSQKIFDLTSVNLSPTTLKRIWGKVKYDSAPTQTTLDTLTRYAGFDHWRAFRQTMTAKETGNIPARVISDTAITHGEKPSKTNENKKKYYPFGFFLGSVCLVFLLAGYFYLRKTGRQQNIKAPVYTFSSHKVLSRGVPNSVVFDYDAEGAPVDSVFIQQSWDQTLSTQVPRGLHQHTSIYYYPGLFLAKLKVGGRVVKESSVFIPTDGWLPLIDERPIPVYFKTSEATGAGKLSLATAQIKSKNILLQPNPPWVSFLNIREFEGIKTDNFIFETSLKNNYQEGSNICQHTEIRILCEGSMISIPVSARGCISENNLFYLGRFLRGRENDLSGFGVDFKDFVKLRLEVINGNARFYIDGKLVYHLESVAYSSKIVGIVYRFKGTGSVDYVKFMKTDGSVVYDDEF